uniref:Uncharacterized protein n=1 Tax=Zea mays TaxID=4577 RepID=A0A804U6W6_MAIZE
MDKDARVVDYYEDGEWNIDLKRPLTIADFQVWDELVTKLDDQELTHRRDEVFGRNNIPSSMEEMFCCWIEVKPKRTSLFRLFMLAAMKWKVLLSEDEQIMLEKKVEEVQSWIFSFKSIDGGGKRHSSDLKY